MLAQKWKELTCCCYSLLTLSFCKCLALEWGAEGSGWSPVGQAGGNCQKVLINTGRKYKYRWCCIGCCVLYLFVRPLECAGFVSVLCHATPDWITCMLKSSGAPLSAVAHTWLPTCVIRSGYECTRKSTKWQHWGHRSGAGQSHLVNMPTHTGQGHYFIFFPVDKIRPTFLLGTENRWPVYLYDTTVSIPPENTQNMMVGTAGAYRPAKGTQEIPLPLQGKASTPQRS